MCVWGGGGAEVEEVGEGGEWAGGEGKEEEEESRKEREGKKGRKGGEGGKRGKKTGKKEKREWEFIWPKPMFLTPELLSVGKDGSKSFPFLWPTILYLFRKGVATVAGKSKLFLSEPVLIINLPPAKHNWPQNPLYVEHSSPDQCSIELGLENDLLNPSSTLLGERNAT